MADQMEDRGVFSLLICRVNCYYPVNPLEILFRL